MQESTDNVDRITARELDALIRSGEKVAVIDVRRREAWTSDPEHLSGAIWLPLDEAPQRARDLPTDARLAVYCS